MSSKLAAPRILVISGSIRRPSFTRALCMEVIRALDAAGAVPIHWEASQNLPIADPAYHRAAREYPHDYVVRLDDEARAADGFVFATPIYHNSFSGVLKNTLDLLNVEPHFRSKPVGLVSHGGGRSSQAVDQLRIVTRGLNAVAIPTQVCTQRSDFDETHPDLVLTNSEILDRVQRFVTELMAFSLLLRPLRHPAAIEQMLARLTEAAS